MFFYQKNNMNLTLVPHQNKPILYGWITVGGSPNNFKNIKVAMYGNIKLAEFSTAYVHLCNRAGCLCIAVKDKNMCKNHLQGEDVYKYCRHTPEICTVRATFGFEPKKFLYCTAHKIANTFDVIHQKCLEPGCFKRPSFGNENDSAQFCAKHKNKEMIDVISKRCAHPGCDTRPNYGIPGSRAEFCFEHKSANMIDLNNKICEAKDCSVRANFGIKGQKVKFCSKHKTSEMVDCGRKWCQFSGCTKHPSYRKLYSTKSIHCLEHSTLNEYAEHRKNPICCVIECNNLAHYYARLDASLYPVRCHEHKISSDIQLIQRACSNCKEILYFPESKEVCMECGKYRPKVLLRFKEQMIQHLFQSNKIDHIHNQSISKNGSKYRPDFLIDTVFGKLIVEIDEFQHKPRYSNIQYDKDQEILRMQVIYQDVQLEFPKSEVLFIRYNPDKYNNGKCDYQNRMKYLYNFIKNMMELKTINFCLAVVYLFYDGFIDNDVKIIPLEINDKIPINESFIEVNENVIIDEENSDSDIESID